MLRGMRLESKLFVVLTVPAIDSMKLIPIEIELLLTVIKPLTGPPFLGVRDGTTYFGG